MKILIIAHTFPNPNNKVRGIFVYQRIKKLQELGHQCLVISPQPQNIPLLNRISKWKKYNIPYRYRIENVNVVVPHYFYIPIKYFQNNIGKIMSKKITKRKTIRLIKEFKPDIIHAHDSIKSGVVAITLSKMLNIPYIVTSHGSDINLGMKNMYLRDLIIKVLSKSSKSIFVSKKLLETAKKFGYNGKNAIVIPNGINENIFKNVDKKKAKEKINIRKDTKVIGFVGNLLEIKGADRIPKIFKLIYQANNKIKFIIVGDGPLLKLLKYKLKDYPVIFTGRIRQKEVAKYMNAMDILILPSRNEGFGCVILEAFACGTYVIGNNVGGIPEAISIYGKTVSNNNEENKNIEERFAEAVIKILKKGYSKKEMVEYALQFSWKEIIKSELRVYNKAVSK